MKRYFVIAWALIWLLLVSLGCWQFSRALQKWRVADQLQGSVIEVIANSQLSSLSDGQRIKITMPVDSQQMFLLDNRSFQGRAGYDVILLGQWQQSKLLINAGWLAGSSYRELLPEIPLALPTNQLTGTLMPLEPGFALDDEPWRGSWPERIQRLDRQLIAARVGEKIADRLLWLEPSLPGLSLRWRPVEITPERHLGYAVQWFAMSLVLLLLLRIWFKQQLQGESDE